MNDVDGFLAATMPDLVEAEAALHRGDVGPRLALWSRQDPVTVFGAWASAAGWDEVSRLFHGLAGRFSECVSYDVDLVAAGLSGDLAYTVAYERTATSVDGAARTYVLRVTQIYRRESGQWKLVHRHGDELAADQPRLESATLT